MAAMLVNGLFTTIVGRQTLTGRTRASTILQRVSLATKTVAKPKPAVSKRNAKTETVYKSFGHHEHILLRPGMYIGGANPITEEMRVATGEEAALGLRKTTYVPGLFTIYDEILVNAADNRARDESTTHINVKINRETNSITVTNNGKGIPSTMQTIEGREGVASAQMPLPQMLFGRLLTGSNFQDKNAGARITGGLNGLGAKLTNIFSKRFRVETVSNDHEGVKRKFEMEWSNNMRDHGDSVVTTVDPSMSDYTMISYSPDLGRFKMTAIDDAMFSLMKKRCFDLAACNPTVNVSFNDTAITAGSLQAYATQCEDTQHMHLAHCKEDNSRYEVVVCGSPNGFCHDSFVNNLATTQGGTHLTKVTDTIIKEMLRAKYKAYIPSELSNMEIKPAHLKKHMHVFVNCVASHPEFNSQNKQKLVNNVDSLYDFVPPPAFIRDIMQNTDILPLLSKQETLKLRSGGASRSVNRSRLMAQIPKLDDAKYAGTTKASQCTLFLTEGDSAKAFAIAGLGSGNRDFNGVFPLKGKLLNVRQAKPSMVGKNDEVQSLFKILGLDPLAKDKSAATLLRKARYGKVMLMTDQDLDGTHIKGLLLNMIDFWWPALLRAKPAFIEQFRTPMVKATYKKESMTFFNVQQLNQWQAEDDRSKWTIKYYKGLGTNTRAEGLEYFKNIEKHTSTFTYDEKTTAENIDMAFSEHRTDDRKKWILEHGVVERVGKIEKEVRLDDFVNQDLVDYSIAANHRSIPSVVDGLKPSQRKVVYGSMERGLMRKELKVPQLAGYVSDITRYHHGESSMLAAIIGMAQDFVGSNNLPLLTPIGMFGTRLRGGEDAASPRYISTSLQTYFDALISNDDAHVIEYANVDGARVEPHYFAPVIPLVLVNGTKGIGMGWSTNVPCHNPKDVSAAVKAWIRKEPLPELLPWHRGFTGSVEMQEGARYQTVGTITKPVVKGLRCRFHVKELPVGLWTDRFRTHLSKLRTDGEILEFSPLGNDCTVDFEIVIDKHTFNRSDWFGGNLSTTPPKALKLLKKESLTNMVLFDANSKIKKYDTVHEILEDFCQVRLQVYKRRHDHAVANYKYDIRKLQNKIKFIDLWNDAGGSVGLDLIRKDRAAAEKHLASLGIDAIEDIPVPKSTLKDVASYRNTGAGHGYLLDQKLWSLSTERADKLRKELKTTRAEMKLFKKKTVQEIWLDELDVLDKRLSNAIFVSSV